MFTGGLDNIEFDIEETRAKLGGSSNVSAGSIEMSLDEDGYRSLDSLFKKNSQSTDKDQDKGTDPPAGGESPKADDTNDLDLPDYLKEKENEFKSPLEVEGPDYVKLFKDTFDLDVPGATEDQFEEKLIEENTRFAIISNKYPSYGQWQQILEGTGYVAEDLVRNVVTSRLKASGITAQSTIDENVSSFFENGELSPLGKKEYESIKSHVKKAISDADLDIKNTIENQKSDRTLKVSKLKEVASDFNIFGIKLPEEITNHLFLRAKWNKGTEFFTEKGLSPEEFARRQLILSLFSDEKAMNKVFRLIDERGVDYGVNQKGKRILN